MRRIAGWWQSEQMWQRHANPWSVYTRFAAIPAMILAVWSRVWIGGWAVVPSALVVVWLLANPFVFPPVIAPRSWAAKGIYGERLWLHDRSSVPAGDRVILRRLIALGLIGLALLAYGLVRLDLWPTLFGATLVIVAQLWRLDRMGMVWERSTRGSDGGC